MKQVARAAALAATFATVVLVGLGLPPLPVTVPDAPPQGAPFAWSQDSVWRALESSYQAARAEGGGRIEPAAARELSQLSAAVDGLDSPSLDPAHPVLRTIESRFMSLGAPVAVCPGLLAEYVTLSGRLRDAVKHQSTRWNLFDKPRPESGRERPLRPTGASAGHVCARPEHAAINDASGRDGTLSESLFIEGGNE